MSPRVVSPEARFSEIRHIVLCRFRFLQSFSQLLGQLFMTSQTERFHVQFVKLRLQCQLGVTAGTTEVVHAETLVQRSHHVSGDRSIADETHITEQLEWKYTFLKIRSRYMKLDPTSKDKNLKKSYLVFTGPRNMMKYYLKSQNDQKCHQVLQQTNGFPNQRIRND